MRDSYVWFGYDSKSHAENMPTSRNFGYIAIEELTAADARIETLLVKIILHHVKVFYREIGPHGEPVYEINFTSAQDFKRWPY